MRVAFVNCVSGLFAIVLIAPALAEPVVTEVIDYYDVPGATAQEVRASLDQLGPTSTRDGRRHDSHTYGKVAWRFTFRGLPNCAITSTTVTAHIITRFPRLQSDAPDSLKKAFAKFTDKLMLYEKGHVQKAIEAARQIEIGIGGLPAISGCRELEAAANHLGHNVLKILGRWHRDYDDTTLYGRTMGAKFP